MRKLIAIAMLLTAMLTGCNEDSNEFIQKGDLTFQFTDESQNSGRTESSPAALVVTIRNEAGELVYNTTVLPLISLGDGYITETLEIDEGTYTIEDFIVIDADNNALYLTPKAGSKLAAYVETTIEHAFEIVANETNDIVMDVIDASAGNPEDFGYVTFSFNIFDTEKCLDTLNYMQFDGVNDRMTIPHSSAFDLGAGNWTMEALFKAEASEQVSFPMLMASRGSGGGFLFGFHRVWRGSEFMIPYIGIGRYNYITEENVPDLLDNEWHHFAAVREGAAISYYVDGDFWRSTTLFEDSTSVNWGSGLDICIGRDNRSPNSTQFDGNIAEVRLWDVARSAEEISDNYYKTLSGTEPGLVFDFQIGKNDQGQCEDLTGSHTAIWGNQEGVDADDPWKSFETYVCLP